MSDEESRALLYRENLRKRNAFQRALAARLAGSRSSLISLIADWEPLRRYLLEPLEESVDNQ